jgi:hypothetical protein
MLDRHWVERIRLMRELELEAIQLRRFAPRTTGARQASLRSTISKISFGKPSFSIAKYGRSRNYFIAVREIFWR